MSTFRVPIVQISKIGKHPNADTLSITQVEGCPVIFRTGDFNPGDLALYIPVDAVIPEGLKGLEFLKYKNGKHRVRAMKLRGIFSMGLLLKTPKDSDHADVGPIVLGQDMAEWIGITKYEEPEPIGMNTGNEKDPGFMPVYDMESYRKFKHLLVPGENVLVTEKIHGCNGRFCFRDGRLWVGSHRTVKAKDERNLWWKVALAYDLEKILAQVPGLVLYGEVYGQVQDLKYGTGPGEIKFAVFDAFNSPMGVWVHPLYLRGLCDMYKLPYVPVLYEGPYDPASVEALADGQSTIAGHIREGFVIRPELERWNMETSRTLFKLVGEAYQLRHGGTEHH